MNEKEDVLPDVHWWQVWPGLGCRDCGGHYWHSVWCRHSAKFRERMILKYRGGELDPRP